MPDRPFVRVYHADMIRDYPDVWDDNDALATWLRLLVAADGSWPAPAELSRSVRARPLATLVAKKLVRLVGAHRFSIKGLDAERNARADAARNAAAKRWHGGRNAEPMPIRAEPSQSEPNRAIARESAIPQDVAKARLQAERTQAQLHFQHGDSKDHPLCPRCQEAAKRTAFR